MGLLQILILKSHVRCDETCLESVVSLADDGLVFECVTYLARAKVRRPVRRKYVCAADSTSALRSGWKVLQDCTVATPLSRSRFVVRSAGLCQVLCWWARQSTTISIGKSKASVIPEHAPQMCENREVGDVPFLFGSCVCSIIISFDYEISSRELSRG